MAEDEHRTNLPAEARRHQIIEAARSVASRDWASFSFIGVAEEAGVTRQTIYNHFDSLTELAFEVMTEPALAFVASTQELADQLAQGNVTVRQALDDGLVLVNGIERWKRQLVVTVLTTRNSGVSADLFEVFKSTMIPRWSGVFEGSAIPPAYQFEAIAFVLGTLAQMSLDEEDGTLTPSMRGALLDRLGLLLEGP